MTFAPSEDSDQTGQMPSLIRVFAVRMKKAWVLSYPLNAQRRLWPDWADAQAHLSIRWAHMPFCWFCHEAAQIFLHFNMMHTLWCLIVLQKTSRSTTKQTKLPVHPAKTHPPSLIKSLLLAWRNLGQLATHWAHSDGSDQIGRMPWLILVFVERRPKRNIDVTFLNQIRIKMSVSYLFLLHINMINAYANISLLWFWHWEVALCILPCNTKSVIFIWRAYILQSFEKIKIL